MSYVILVKDCKVKFKQIEKTKIFFRQADIKTSDVRLTRYLNYEMFIKIIVLILICIPIHINIQPIYNVYFCIRSAQKIRTGPVHQYRFLCFQQVNLKN